MGQRQIGASLGPEPTPRSLDGIIVPIDFQDQTVLQRLPRGRFGTDDVCREL